MYISPGHPESRNVKTIVKADELVTATLQDVEYELFKV